MEKNSKWMNMNVEENEINNRNNLIFTIITDLYRLKNSCKVKVFVTIAGDWQKFSRRQYLTIKYVFQVKCKCTVRVQLVIRRTLCPLTLITESPLTFDTTCSIYTKSSIMPYITRWPDSTIVWIHSVCSNSFNL